MARQEKNLSVSRWWWRRIARNMARFGWDLFDAYKLTTTRYDSDGFKRKAVTMEMIFLREESNFENLPEIALIERKFNFWMIIRRVFGVLLYIFNVMLLIALILRENDVLRSIFGASWFIVLFIWFTAIFFENKLSRKAEKILIRKKD
ncbi:MAG: hypothetical protein IJU10_01755 [Clostridia bacterium]|nr:hypothetical protein [Clostridia bacterium]